MLETQHAIRLSCVAALLMVAGCVSRECSESSEAVAHARSLPDWQLASIHKYATGATETIEGRFDKIRDAPSTVLGLAPDFVKIAPGEGVIYLEVCGIDSNVILATNRRDDAMKFIMLEWGEGPDSRQSEILWREAESVGDSID